MKLLFKKLNPDAKIPSYAHPGDVGLDLYCLESFTLLPAEHKIISHGFALEFPEGFAALVHDKSGISKAGMKVMGGVFDAGYRGEYNTHLVNLSDKSYSFEKGDKTSQLIIFPVVIATIEEVAELSDSSRGDGRFGSTGKQ
jgi:dUTP pyrophosphatase